MRSYGIMGGTYDPVHKGHIHVCKAFANELKLEKVFIIPTNLPPHKSESQTSAVDRLNMIRIAASGDKRFIASDIEIRRGGKSYTADTLLSLVSVYSDTRFFLLTGSDMFFTFEKWYRPDIIAKNCILCTVPRKASEMPSLELKAEELEKVFGAKCKILNISAIEISSTELRARIGRGEDVSAFIDSGVLTYIQKNNIYA